MPLMAEINGARVDQLANYTVYDPASDHIEFLRLAGRSGPSNLGFR